jgi:hypothetical protein
LEHFLFSNDDLAVTEEEARDVIHQVWTHICDIYDVAKTIPLPVWPPEHTWLEINSRGYDYSIYLGEEDYGWELGSWMFKDGQSDIPDTFALLRIVMRFGQYSAQAIKAFEKAGLPPTYVTLDQATWTFPKL